MFAVITADYSGEALACYKLADVDLLDCDLYAKRYADEQGLELDIQPGAHVPTGCADFTVTLQDEPGAVRCWNSQSYFIAAQEEF